MAHHDLDDYTVEPVRGLPEALPEGERILWQGRPDAVALARESLALRWAVGYFVFLAAWRIASVWGEGPLPAVLLSAVPFVLLGAGVGGFLWLFSWLQARSTVYTITTERVAMRVGAAITQRINLPYRWIESADLMVRSDGTGSIFMRTKGETRLAYLGLWPHVRPWAMKKTEPAFRAIPDAARVARILGEAAETRISQPEITRVLPDAVPAE